MTKFKFFVLIGLVYLAIACSTSPTGRSQFQLLPESQMSAMGEQSFNELKAKTLKETDSNKVQRVHCVAEAIVKSLDSDEYRDGWEVVVFKEDQTINAFALPGKKIGVYTGILPVAKNNAQLATVLGHEVGHVLAHHGNERVSQSLMVQGGLSVLDAVLARESKNRDLLFAGLGLGLQVGVLLPFSRTQESEADVIGLRIMANAGFDPKESIAFWQNMQKASGGSSTPGFLSTHPTSATRIRDLSRNLPEAEELHKQATLRGRTPRC